MKTAFSEHCFSSAKGCTVGPTFLSHYFTMVVAILAKRLSSAWQLTYENQQFLLKNAVLYEDTCRFYAFVCSFTLFDTNQVFGAALFRHVSQHRWYAAYEFLHYIVIKRGQMKNHKCWTMGNASLIPATKAQKNHALARFLFHGLKMSTCFACGY